MKSQRKTSLSRIIALTLFLIIYIVVSLGIFVILVDFSNQPIPVDFVSLSEASKHGIAQEASRLLISIDDFVKRYVVSTRGIEVQINETILLLVSLITLFPLMYFLFTVFIVNRIEEKDTDGSTLDSKRKDDLKKINHHIVEFHHKNNRYPNEDEFIDLLNNVSEVSQDPLVGKSVAHHSDLRFGYYYDQYNSTSGVYDQNYYRLWCYLQNGDKYTITPDIPTTSDSE